MSIALDHREAPLLELGRQLKGRGYRFTTVTPSTHARVNARADNRVAVTLEDVFGWSRPFAPDALPEEIVGFLREADAIVAQGNLCRSTVRFSTIDQLIFVHSAFPTADADAVFFGPDTYRFANALRAALAGHDAATIVDVGCGSGAGGLYLRSFLPARAPVDLILSDINPMALRAARINAVLNGHAEARVIQGDVMNGVADRADIIISNPPYLVDGAERVYRHGGGSLGFDLALRIVEEAIPRLAPGGQLLLYTGAPVVQGVDKFREAVVPRLGDCAFTYQEIDPDVFGEELDEPAYTQVDRLAVVVLTVTAPGGPHVQRHSDGH